MIPDLFYIENSKHGRMIHRVAAPVTAPPFMARCGHLARIPLTALRADPPPGDAPVCPWCAQRWALTEADAHVKRSNAGGRHPSPSTPTA